MYELIDALPDTETLAAKRYLEFLLSRGEIEYSSPEDLSELEEGLTQIWRGECLNWEEFKQKHKL